MYLIGEAGLVIYLIGGTPDEDLTVLPGGNLGLVRPENSFLLLLCLVDVVKCPL